jgi:hypothetical protein
MQGELGACLLGATAERSDALMLGAASAERPTR